MRGFDAESPGHHGADVVTGEHRVRESEVDRAYLVESIDVGGGELDLQGAEVVLELGEGARTEDRSGDARVGEGPGQPDLGRGTTLLGDLLHDVDDGQIAFGHAVEGEGEVEVASAVGSGRTGGGEVVAAVLSGEQPTGQR